jgi:cytosine/creatinine deaminase
VVDRSPSVGAPDARPSLTGTAIGGLHGVRLPAGGLGDLALGPGPVLDGAGWRALPAAVEPHAHLDKALTAPRVDPGAGNDLGAAIAQWRAILPGIDTADIAARALAALSRYVANGITTIRSHVDLPLEGDPFRGVDALVAVREAVRGTAILQVCLLANSDAPTEVIAEAVARGVDVVGGCPHLAADPRREVTRMLDLAERHGLPVDLHCDEQTAIPDTDAELDVVMLADQVIERGLRQRIAASHAVRLGMLPPERLDRVLDRIAESGIGLVTLPITNLYLQGWTETHAAPRGLAPLRALLDRGIPLGAGADNLRDPFNPVGRADPFETTSLLVTAGHLRLEEALHAVTDGAREVLGAPGGDLVLVPDGDLGDVLAGGVGARVVIHGGRVVADTRVAQSVDLPLELPALAR